MAFSILAPHGGFVESLARIFRGIFLQPALTGGILLATHFAPSQVQRALSRIPHGNDYLGRSHRPLVWFLALGIAYRLNNYLSNRVLNNWTTDAWDWEKEVVVVTGGNNGIGAATVQSLSNRGVKVVVLDVSEPRGQLPKNVRFYKLDVRFPEAIRKVAALIRQEVGHPTVLVNNAGIAMVKSMLKETEDDIRRLFDINIVSHFWLLREFLPHMIEQNHGHIVTIASAASYLTMASNVDYSCSKAGALALHEGLSQELKYRYNANLVRTRYVEMPLVTQNSHAD